ncbi:hypothetical protein HWV62_30312 [Athelia sp. TMB]|nr:hypothetical protein HWV62_30312 [Athelia sp. TMB]
MNNVLGDSRGSLRVEITADQNQPLHTTELEKTREPRWNQDFQIYANPGSNFTISVQIGDQALGHVNITTADLLAQCTSGEPYAAGRGSITVALRHIPDVPSTDAPAKVGLAALERYDQTRSVADLEEAILNFQRATDLAESASPVDANNLCDLRCYLAEVRKARFEIFGDTNDLVATISSLRSAVDMTADTNPNKPDFLNNLGMTQLSAFELLGHDVDLHESINSLRKAVIIMDADDPRKSSTFNNLSLSLLVRYERLGDACDVDEAFSILHQAIQHTDISSPLMLKMLVNLVRGRRSRFQRIGDVADLNDSIADMLRAVEATGHRRADYLDYLANTYVFRFDSIGDTADLEAALRYSRSAVDLTGDDDWLKPDYLSALAGTFGRLHERFGRAADLEEMIAAARRAVLLTSDFSPSKGSLLSSLSAGLLSRFESHGNVEDLNEALSSQQNAVNVTRDGHGNKAGYICSLGVIQKQCCQHFNEQSYLEDAIANLALAVRMVSVTDHSRPFHLACYGAALRLRFQRLGALVDLEEAISVLNEAVDLTDDKQPEKAAYLNTLGNCQSDRFIRTGELNDLENSIISSRHAVALTLDTHLAKAQYLTSLGTAQGRLFRRVRELSDIREAISNLKEAIRVNRKESEAGSLHSNLSISELSLFDHSKQPTDLDDAIDNAELALRLMRDDRLQVAAGYHYNCANGYITRFKYFHHPSDIHAALQHYQRAADLTLEAHPDKPTFLSVLGHAQQFLFEDTHDAGHLLDAISNCTRAIELSQEDDPEHAKFLINCAGAYKHRYRQLHNPDDFHNAIAKYKLAAHLINAYPSDMLNAARIWAVFAHENGYLQVALEGYRMALSLMHKVAWLGVSTESHHRLLESKRSENWGCMAASCAIELGRLEEAVELLESARSIFWQHASDLRVDLTALREDEPALAAELEKAGRLLDAPSFFGPSTALHSADRELASGLTPQERRSLVRAWEALLDRVRKIPKFQYFLRPVPFQQLRRVATGGQVVIIIISEQFGGDAIIFDSVNPITHISLPNVDVEDLQLLCGDILLRRPANASIKVQERYVKQYLKPALRAVWRDVINPIFNAIGLPSEPQDNLPTRRIWWYPTGPLTFAPLHAAGPGTKLDVSRLVISSYITTLGSMFRAQQKARTGQAKLLTVSQPNTPGQRPLPLSSTEVNQFREAVRQAGWLAENISSFTGEEASVQRVSNALGSSSWVHFACHGLQDASEGMKSAFALDDGNLTLGEIASKRVEVGQFAFLSACNAATGIRTLPAESMHLAAGLQFAGFPSVIATLWAIADTDAPRVAARVYEYLLRNGAQRCDPAEAATALNCAILALREDPTVTVDRWSPFMHCGI